MRYGEHRILPVRPKLTIELRNACLVLFIGYAVGEDNGIRYIIGPLFRNSDIVLVVIACDEYTGAFKVGQDSNKFRPVRLSMVDSIDIVQNLATVLRRLQFALPEFEFDEVSQAVRLAVVFLMSNADIRVELAFRMSIDHKNARFSFV